jgi:hypothetical protein
VRFRILLVLPNDRLAGSEGARRVAARGQGIAARRLGGERARGEGGQRRDGDGDQLVSHAGGI